LDNVDPRKHAIPPAPPAGAPERYDCPSPHFCTPPVWQLAPSSDDGNSMITLPWGARYLPNDEMWVWECAHGRPFFLHWSGAITTAEMMDAFRAGSADAEAKRT